jgi:hypothetical protein
MAHEVRIKLATNVVVAHKDIEVVVSGTAGRLGRLLISRGNIEWFPTKKTIKKHRLSWEKFAETMEELGKKVRKKG